jgi:hypothetical protein
MHEQVKLLYLVALLAPAIPLLKQRPVFRALPLALVGAL